VLKLRGPLVSPWTARVLGRLVWALPFLVVALVVTVPAIAWLTWERPSAITRENYLKLNYGMSLKEVEQILGGPARIEATDPAARAFFASHGPPGLMKWANNHYGMGLRFDADGRLAGRWATQFAGPAGRPPRSPETVLDVIFRWLGL
jgi:hypothetical protein